MFILETVQTEGIAQLSYFLADKSSGRALVIDPRTDVDIYIRLARKHGVSIQRIMETHIHADFVCGSRELASRVGNAQIHASGESAGYDFNFEPICDGAVFDFGSFALTARHTPGHTPEHMAFELTVLGDEAEGDQLVAVFTGDSLFAGSAGRPDLLGDSATNELTQQLHETLYEYFLKLDDHLIIYPGHGAGSACGAGISDRLVSTIGYERRNNPFLKHRNYESFYRHVVVEAPHAPSHYPRLKKVNASDRPLFERLPTIPALPPAEFNRAVREPNSIIIDTRQMLAFAGGHVPGAINIGNRPSISVWMGDMFDGDETVFIIAERDSGISEIQNRMIRVGVSNFGGYLAGGMRAWEESGLRMETMPIVTANELKEMSGPQRGHQLILDVRSPQEFSEGHLPGAEHYFVGDMRHRIDGLNKAKPTIVYCASGYRASIAASLMKSRGFEHITNFPGSFKAWEAVGGEIEAPKATPLVTS